MPLSLASAVLFFFLSAAPNDNNVAPAAAAAPAARAALRVVSASSEGLVLEFACDSFVLAEDRLGTAVTFDGAEAGPAGAPDLPHLSVLVGLPQSGTARLSATPSETRVLGGVRLRPAPGFAAADPAAQPQSGTWPAHAAELGPVETMRGVRVARLTVNPAQHDAATGELRLHRRVRVQISFTDRPSATSLPDPLDGVIAAALANGEQAVRWKLDRLPGDTLNFFERSTEWCRIRLDTTGVYRVTPANLKAAGWQPENIDPATFRLYTIGPYEVGGNYPDTMVEVPLHVVDNGDGRFSGSDALLFFAEAPSRYEQGDTTWRFNPYARYSAFWLTWGGGAGRRMSEVSGATAASPPARGLARQRLERDLLCPARSGLLWLWTNIFKPTGTLKVAETIALSLPDRDTIHRVSGRLLGRAPDNQSLTYRGRVWLNGTLIDTLRIPAASRLPPQTLFNFAVPVAAGARSGADTVVIELYGEPEMDVFLDWLEVQYTRRLSMDRDRGYLELWGRDSAAGLSFALDGGAAALVLDVTDPWNPARITGGRVDGGRLSVEYRPGRPARVACALPERARAPAAIERRSPGGLRSPGLRADYYIVAPDEFAQAAELLARYRAGNVPGLGAATARVARLSQIYDDYGFGMDEPAAIKRFLQAKQPAYVLLAGDGNYDYRDILGLGKPAGVPPFELGYDIDPEVYGNTARALDAWYADLDGGGGLPDLILGRVTCRSAVELRAFVDKVRGYEKQPPGYWSKRFLLVADDEWLGQVGPRYIDPIGFRHISSCELMNTLAPELLDPAKIYLTEYPLTTTNLKAGAQADLLRRLDDGALLWAFFGHGAGFQLCHEQILHITNTVPQVKTGLRQSVAFFGSCGVGRFDDTRYEAVAEELVRRDEGCIVTVAATKATDPGGNEALARQFFTFLTQQPDQSVGAAFFSAWRINPLYHYFGDPALRLRLPARGIAPTVQPDTLWPGGRVTVECSTPALSGSYELAGFEEQWYRRYQSEVGLVAYRLNGYNLHRANGRFDSGRINAEFIVPRVEYPETTVVPNGSYVREAGTGRVSVLAWNADSAWTSTSTGLWLGDSAIEPDDNAPPEIELWADNIRLRPGDTTDVPRSFTLQAVVTDPSGILLVPNVDAGLSMQIGTAPRVEVHERFRYDNNSSTTGRFSYPVRLEQRRDAITVIATDNIVSPLNSHRRIVQVALRTRLDEALELTDVLVYPNPYAGFAGDPARFTFNLSRPAYVTVKIYTLAGRLIRALPARLCGLGYGELEWDGLDSEGRTPANGVYLYKLDARSSGTGLGTGSSSASFRDRFIIHR